MIDKLNYMLSELDSYRHSKQTLMKMYVSDRLEKSFNEYNKELQQSISYLTQKHEKSLIKRMRKINEESS